MSKKAMLLIIVIGAFLGISPEVSLAISAKKKCADAFSACVEAKDQSTKCNEFQHVGSTGTQTPTPMDACQAGGCHEGFHACQ